MAKVSVKLKSGRITRIAPRAAAALVQARLVTMVARAEPAALPPAPEPAKAEKPKRQYKRRDMAAEVQQVETQESPADPEAPAPGATQSQGEA